MQPIWGVAVAIGVFLLILFVRNRRRRSPAPKQYSRQLEGAEIVAYLHPRVSRGCLVDHGLKFGKGFRRKQGPALPHDSECQCRDFPFSHSGSEVFNGALRQAVPPTTSIPELPPEEAALLLEVLTAAGAENSGTGIEGSLDRFGKASRPAVEAFLRERQAFLREPGAHLGG